MGFTLEDGTGSGKLAGVSEDHRLKINAKVAHRMYYCSRDMGDAYTISIIRAMAANDYSLWIRNDSETHFVIHKIITSSVDANVEWKLWNTTGQIGATATAVTPQPTNLTSSLAAQLTVLGLNATVAGLTAHDGQTKLLATWRNGGANNTVIFDDFDCFRIGQNQSIMFEYHAGTGGVASIVVFGFYDEIT